MLRLALISHNNGYDLVLLDDNSNWDELVANQVEEFLFKDWTRLRLRENHPKLRDFMYTNDSDRCVEYTVYEDEDGDEQTDEAYLFWLNRDMYKYVLSLGYDLSREEYYASKKQSVNRHHLRLTGI